MLRRILLSSIGAVALAGAAFAADLPSRAPPPVYVPPAPIFTWTGVYVGAQIGYAWGSGSANFGDGLGNFISANGSGTNGVIGGGHVGYNLQLGQYVVGLEGSIDGASLNKSASGTIFLPAGGVVPVTLGGNASIQGSIRGRVGYAFDRVLLYATGGVAFAGTTLNYSTPFSYDSASTTKVGWTVGGGVEYAVTNNWSIRAEYRYSGFGNTTLYPTVFNSTGLDVAPFVNRKFSVNQVQVGFSYKFDAFAPPAPVVAKY